MQELFTIFSNNVRICEEQLDRRRCISITKRELVILIEDLKDSLLIHMAKQIDTLYTHKKQEEAKKALVVFCPTCRKKNGIEECPYNRRKIYP